MNPKIFRRPLRILTWHVHGNYLYYLTQCPHEFYLPVKPDRPPGYSGRAPGFPWPAHVHDVPANRVKNLELDCILYQSQHHYLHDQYEILSAEQRRLPTIFLEHDPPREQPTDTRHPVDDPDGLLVHVTHFNELMWNSGRTPTHVIEHGVLVPDTARYRGDLVRGVVVINMLERRGRRLGADLFRQLRTHVPLDLIGMGSEELGGLGEVRHDRLPEVLSRYRFLLNPIRYTSLGLAVCEAMMIGLPIVGLATTEMVTTVENGVSGYVDTDWRKLIGPMNALLRDRSLARRLGDGARRAARARFSIERFTRDWDQTFRRVTQRTSVSAPVGASVTMESS
jgi:glycosyltransferase involved in cell wall biosynthesis